MKLISIKINDTKDPKFRISLIVCNLVGIGITPFWHLRPRWAYCGILPGLCPGCPRQLVLRVLWFGIGIRMGRSS